MVSCKHCATLNNLDSDFCRRCGTPLPDNDRQEAQVKLDALIGEGIKALAEGRTEEAMAVAESATIANPASLTAWALKSDCHARRGEVAEALECAERLVELNPDSELDKIKRNQLRSALVSNLRLADRPDKRVATMGAFAAFVLVLFLGAAAATFYHNKDSNSPVADNSLTNLNSVPSNGFYPNGAGEVPNQSQTRGDARSSTDPSDTPAINNQANPSRPTVNPLPTGLPSAPDGMLPRPDGSGAELNVRLVNPEIRGQVSPTPNATGPAQSADPDPSPSATTSEPVAATPPKENAGFIEINVRPGRSNRVTNSGSENSGAAPISSGGIEALVRTGTQQFQLGNYAGAAGTFERAVKMGGSPTVLNQRLGQAYEHLGRNQEAAGAYQRAVTAGQADIAAGRGNRERLQAIVETCRQALRALPGG